MQYITAAFVFVLIHIICQVSSNRLKLMPLSMQKKLCEKNPLLKICSSVQNYVFTETDEIQKDGFSEWDICNVRPDLGFCSQRKTVVVPAEDDVSELSTTFEAEAELESSGELMDSDSNGFSSYFATEIQPLDI
uniref:Secreted phosphoprotein 24 n=1 Tax=Syphacia muris TaxID=451379 RepID=A0A0N5AAM9_9BILA